MYGTQTVLLLLSAIALFENDVKMYGTQTVPTLIEQSRTFENDVKMYGTQTGISLSIRPDCLRMM